jgi:hypothetical protein
MIPVFFCLRHDHSASQYKGVLDSLKRQTVPCNPIEVKTQGGSENTHRTYSLARQQSEAECRRLIFTAMSILPDKYACMSDNDNDHLLTTNIADLIKHMDEHDKCGAVALHWKGPKHPDIGFAIYRVEMVQKMDIPVPVNKYGSCMCEEVREAVEATGYTFDKLDNLKRIWEH